MATTNINVGLGIKLEGDWAKALALIGRNDLAIAVVAGTKQGQLASANKIKAIVKQNLRRGSAPNVYWPDYSYQYGNRKARLGYGDKKWRLTDTYYKAITVMDRGTTVSVGVPKNAKGKFNKNPLTLGAIANILERGSKAHNIAARPLWRPAFKQFGGKARVAYHINFHIRKAIYLSSGIRGIKI